MSEQSDLALLSVHDPVRWAVDGAFSLRGGLPVQNLTKRQRFWSCAFFRQTGRALAEVRNEVARVAGAAQDLAPEVEQAVGRLSPA